MGTITEGTIRIGDRSDASQSEPASAYKLVADLERLGILNGITGGKRGRMYTFEAYVKLFR